METIAKAMWKVSDCFHQLFAKMIFDFAIKIVDLEVETTTQQEKHYIMSLEFPISLQSNAHF